MFCKQRLSYTVHIDWCNNAIYKHSCRFLHICVNCMYLNDIGVASLSLRGLTSSLMMVWESGEHWSLLLYALSKTGEHWSLLLYALSKTGEHWSLPLYALSKTGEHWSLPLYALSKTGEHWSLPLYALSKTGEHWSLPLYALSKTIPKKIRSQMFT